MSAIVGRFALVFAAVLAVATAAGLARLGAADQRHAQPSPIAPPAVVLAKDEARLVSESVDGAPVSLVLLVTADGLVVERPAAHGGFSQGPAALEH